MSVGNHSLPAVVAPRGPTVPAIKPFGPSLYRWSASSLRSLVSAGIVVDGAVELDSGFLFDSLKRSEPLAPTPLIKLLQIAHPSLTRGDIESRLHQFTTHDYDRLAELGLLSEDDSVELLQGWIVHKMARNSPHDEALENLDYIIRPLLPAGLRVRNQSALVTTDGQPEPDLMVCTPIDQRRGRKPTGADVLLVVEVADTSLDLDRRVKGPIFAKAGVPIYWIVNIPDRRFEVFTEPTGPTTETEVPRYRAEKTHREGESVPVAIQGNEVGQIAVSDVLPSVASTN